MRIWTNWRSLFLVVIAISFAPGWSPTVGAGSISSEHSIATAAPVSSIPHVSPPPAILAKAATASTPLVVTNTNDSGSGSLRALLDVANSTTNATTISFNLSGPGPWTITLNDTLFVNSPVTIDGSTQPGYDNAHNRVYLELAPNITTLLSIFLVHNTGGSYIKGLGMDNYTANAVTYWKDASWNFLIDDYMGFRKLTDGSIYRNTTRAPQSAAVGIQGSYNKVIHCTISGVYNGINLGEAIEQPTTGLITHDNYIAQNRIGTDPTGQTTVGYGNTSTGIFMGAGVQSSWIGGYNVIAGNGGSAVEILHPTDSYNRIYYNYLGVNDGATAPITGPANNQGIFMGNGAQHNAAWNNYTSNNRYSGITLSSASDNFVLNNIIGLDINQHLVLGTQPVGITLNVDRLRNYTTGSVRNSIQGNMVSGMTTNGIEIYNGVGNGVYNNWIGTNYPGEQIGNRYWNVYLQDSSYNSGNGNAWGPSQYGKVGQTGAYSSNNNIT